VREARSVATMSVPRIRANYEPSTITTLDPCVGFALTAFPGHSCVGFIIPGNGRWHTYWYDGEPGMVTEALRRFRSEGRILVGYDPAGHETHLLAGILAGCDPYKLSLQLTAASQQEGYYRPRPAALPCEYIDLAMRLSVRGQSPSLTSVAANLGEAIIAESPFPPGTVLTDEQWEGARAFNQVVLWQVWAVLEHLLPEIQAIETLAPEVGRDLRSVPKAQVVEELFKSHYHRKTGRLPVQPQPPREVTYQPVAGVRRPRTPEAAAWFDTVTTQPMKVGEQGRVTVPVAKFRIGRTRLSGGGGGLHSQDAPALHISGPKHQIVSIDVSSFYPSLIALKGITPRAYGEHGQAIFREILDRRMDLKRRISQAAGEAKERLERQSYALKIVLNATFGKMGSSYSTLYDPESLVRVTISGQLMMLDLVERLTAADIRILSVNTDGLTLRCRRDQPWRQVVEEWQAETGMRLDIEPIQRLAVMATNCYAVKGRDGKHKRRGKTLRGDIDTSHVPSFLVDNDAIAAALLDDVPPEITIRNCTDPIRFCTVTRLTPKVARAVLRTNSTQAEIELARVTRWYKRRGAGNCIVHTLESGLTRTLAGATDVGVVPDLSKGLVPQDVDYSWYIKEARKQLQKVRVPKCVARKLIGDHPLASTVFNHGLMPCPKWDGKSQPLGSDARAPSPIWDWSGVQTVGAYTGPNVATLILDIDEHAKFAGWAFGGDSPQLVGRHRDLDGCLTVGRGDATAEQVRRGQARGKLVFRCPLEPDHPLATLPVGYWRKKLGVDIFFGGGIPSVLGAHPDGSPYRLEGELTPAPAWLIEGLRPRNNSGKLSAASRGPELEIPASLALEGLPKILEELAPELARSSIGWHTKTSRDGREIWVGRCPFPHESRSSNSSDLVAGYSRERFPYVRCSHTTCTAIPVINRDLKAWFRRQLAVASPKSELDLGPIAISIRDDLAAGLVAHHSATQGGGKSFAIAQAGAERYRQGQLTVLAFPTIRLCGECIERLQKFVPEAFASGHVAKIFGYRSSLDESFVENDADRFGENAMDKSARIIVCTHAQLARRGFSRYLRALWRHLEAVEPGPDREEQRPGRAPFAIIVDESRELIRHLQMEIPLGHRFSKRVHPDGDGGTIVYLSECPKKSRSGNCGNCVLELVGPESEYGHGIAIRELRHPAPVKFDSEGKRLRQFNSPVTLAIEDFELGPEVRVGTTTFAAAVVAYQGRKLGQLTRHTAPIRLFERDRQSGKHPKELPGEIITSMLEFAHHPRVTWERPVKATSGETVDPIVLAAKIGEEQTKWDTDLIFPRATCNVARLRFTDLAVLEQMRRYAEAQEVGVVLAGPALSPDERDVLKTIWPDLEERSYDAPSRKIKQVALVFPDGYCGPGALIGRDDRLITVELEKRGLGLIFLPTKDAARTVYRAVSIHQPSLRAVFESDVCGEVQQTILEDTEVGTYVTYSRGVLGSGTNLHGIRHLVVYANAFRHIGGFAPGEVSPEAFERARAVEQLGLIFQNIGRALRGEPDQTLVVFVLNADPPLLDVLKTAPAIIQGSEIAPVVATGHDLNTLVEQAGRWLDAGGGEWPTPGPQTGSSKRRGGRPKRGKETVLKAAEAALKKGVSWREFRNTMSPQRSLTKTELAELRRRFAG